LLPLNVLIVNPDYDRFAKKGLFGTRPNDLSLSAFQANPNTKALVKKILVLDDNQDILDMVEAVLNYENYEVECISDGSNFIAYAESVRPDLVLLDFRLSGKSGDELCRQIKSHPNLSHIPVVIFSAYLFNDADLKKLSCDAVIAKPFDINELVDKLTSLLQAV